ncbi:MAG: SPFH/Band 7/PHB domain protein [Gammaproteobacteria bacterium]|nr:SPFH/Band 7/PHB domain protein [Gammaproteobacteria bacterium]MDE0441240.1 SPFH/Band 7/PHB domain protein [Gammaproteobacteria bacterium]
MDILLDVLAVVLVAFAVVLAWNAIQIVPQSNVFVIERFGRYRRTLMAGLNFIVPILDRVAHRVSIIERQLPTFRISVITRDNVEVDLDATVFFRVIEAEKSVYRIQEVDQAILTAAQSIVRSAGGKLELDELQSSRQSMSDEIATNLQSAAEVWGLEITRTEIVDVVVDEQTKAAQRQQLNAERERRALVAKAEGDKRALELAADAELYQAQQNAAAVRVTADADAYATRQKAAADAEQTRLLADAIANDGQPAADFEIRKRQVEAIADLASASNAKTVVLPTQVVGVLGALESIASLTARPSSDN